MPHALRRGLVCNPSPARRVGRVGRRTKGHARRIFSALQSLRVRRLRPRRQSVEIRGSVRAVFVQSAVQADAGHAAVCFSAPRLLAVGQAHEQAPGALRDGNSLIGPQAFPRPDRRETSLPGSRGGLFDNCGLRPVARRSDDGPLSFTHPLRERGLCLPGLPREGRLSDRPFDLLSPSGPGDFVAHLRARRCRCYWPSRWPRSSGSVDGRFYLSAGFGTWGRWCR